MGFINASGLQRLTMSKLCPFLKEPCIGSDCYLWINMKLKRSGGELTGCAFRINAIYAVTATELME